MNASVKYRLRPPYGPDAAILDDRQWFAFDDDDVLHTLWMWEQLTINFPTDPTTLEI